MELNDAERSANDIEVSPINYLGTTAFVIGLLVQRGYLKVRRDNKGRPHFMKSDIDHFLSSAQPVSRRTSSIQGAAETAERRQPPDMRIKAQFERSPDTNEKD